MAGTGKAMHKTPESAQRSPTIFPGTVFGTTSPYPTVVIVTIAHQNEARKCLLIKKGFLLENKIRNFHV